MEVIQKFYEAFEKLDADAMAACYHDEVVFEDPAFGRLKGERARNMWRMLVNNGRGSGINVRANNIQGDEQSGSAQIEAKYVFSQTGRPVVNHISSQFKLKDGKIIEHIDQFDLYKWAKQAIGWKGYLLGWTGMFKNKMQMRTNSMLDKFERNN